MIRFRNPGTQYTTQVQVFKELYKQYKDVASFDLDDMALTIASTKLMTAYGYAGEDALALSNTDNDSLNSTKMNAKMYAEVFRLLGWITSAGNSSYPLVFTYIGEHVAASDDVLPLYEQCVLGINNPQDIMDVKYEENVRFFKAALLTMVDLGGIIYKHELCLGPMSIDDLDVNQYRNMITKITNLRGSYSRYQAAYAQLCTQLGVKPTLPDNSTRLPIAFMKTCGWVESQRTNRLYPPKSLECLVLTPHGRELAGQLSNLKDMRLDEFEKYPVQQQHALIRLGVYSMLQRAGYDVSPVKHTMENDAAVCKDILQGKQLLFSPYQTIKHEIVDHALGITRTAGVAHTQRHFSDTASRTEAVIQKLELIGHSYEEQPLKDEEVERFTSRVNALYSNCARKDRIIEQIFSESISATQGYFYPFIAMLFRVMGLECYASRPGDNGARWDAIIIDNKQSIPIEIKSPTEEQHLSLKAIRQAVENKIILLSRNTHPTCSETTTLAVGYYLPNDRAEVTNMIHDFKAAYGISIGVIDLKTLLTLAISVIIDRKAINFNQLCALEGFADASVR